ncbi:MAG: MBOAT family protein [Clostridium sp.]|nr:MBOAT family protein [Clostridium sp.]
MVFSSEVFLFIFLPIIIIVYHLVGRRFKNICLFLASLFFYAWGEPVYVLLLLASIAVNYVVGLLFDVFRHKVTAKKIVLVIACIGNICFLGYFKYITFLVMNLNRLGTNLLVPDVKLPIGISFYTFQILSYVIDAYRGRVKIQHNILSLGLYVSLFPQLIAGPIVRYSDIEKEIDKRSSTAEDFYLGAKRFMFGFAKKVVIADTVCKIADTAFLATDLSMNMAWLGIIAYAAQIYFDFSGYSDMAIGLGRMFGFHFSENFNYPYISKSIKEFWRRWHISLGSWFRDYVYIPMGGSRCSKARTYFNLIFVFALTGLWHGASWNFVAWGLYYAFFLVLERIFGNFFEKIPAIIKHVYAVVVILVGWVFFRAEGLTAAFHYIRAMVSFEIDQSPFISISIEGAFMLIVAILLSMPVYKGIERVTEKKQWITDIMAVLCFMLGIMYMVGAGFSPFLYYRF